MTAQEILKMIETVDANDPMANGGTTYVCTTDKISTVNLEQYSPHLFTEELAELHAIIQAIEYERGNK